MTFGPSNSMESALPENVSFATDWNQFLIQWTELYRKMATKINDKERGFYPQEYEIPNCQRFFDTLDSQKYREGFRKVIDTGALLNAAPTAVVHSLNEGAAVPNTWTFTRITGFAIDPATPLWIPLANGGIHDCSLQVTATQVIITPTVNLAAFTNSYIILEYLKN